MSFFGVYGGIGMNIYISSSCKNLMVVAHPDDESLWGGAHLSSGDWFIVCLTNGNDKIRAKEFKEVLEYTHNHGVILSYPDLVNGVKSDWFTCQQEIINDLSYVLDYKDWNMIVTHSPSGETNHIHHLKTHGFMYSLCRDRNLLEHLYYFGRFYEKGKIPSNLPLLTKEEFSFKRKIVSIYAHETKPINLFWSHMIPYENWIANKEWK